ncbi:MAG: polyprenyl synthetase family protein [Oligoflexales bacterium]|nr:polyprenyl synthetase family protein [Oligoflexales bacterium]
MTFVFEAQRAEQWKAAKLTSSQLLIEAFSPIASEMQQLAEQIPTYIQVESQTAAHFLKHVFQTSGKRIRPALYFLCCRMLGYRGEQVIPMAAVCEFIHIASLLHDDVVDNAPIRRGKASANALWGDEVAVLMGDLIYSRASEMMAATGSLEIVETFASAIRIMSEGEILQLENQYNINVSDEAYFKVLQAKTGTLIGSACKVAGLLANCTKEQCNALFEFGKKIGIAFQLIDDAIDYTSTSGELGKQQYADLREGKFTYPILHLIKQLSPSELETLSASLLSKDVTDREITYISTLIKKHRSDEATLKLADQYTQSALSYVKEYFPDTEERQCLISLANLLVQRNF